jgi:hypothetical protein
MSQVLLHLHRQGALLTNRPLKGYDDRDSEVAEQADIVLCVRLDHRTKSLGHLGQKKSLEVDYQTAAVIEDNALRHGPFVINRLR